MGQRKSDEAQKAAMRRALAFVIEALDTIDGFEGSPTVAAHLDMAIVGLREVLEGSIASEQPSHKLPS